MALSAITPPRPVGDGLAWVDTHGFARHPGWVIDDGSGPQAISLDAAIDATGDVQTVLADTADALAWVRGMGDHANAEEMLYEIRSAGVEGLIGWALWAEVEGEPILPVEAS